jgi:cell division transport system permease protein
MKIRTVKYIISEGMVNAYRNKLMSLASISIITASLIVFGIFFIFVVNLNFNLYTLKQQPHMQVFCYAELDDTQVANVENALKNNDKIEEYTKVTKEEAFQKVKEMLGNDVNVLEGIDNSFLPVSFIIKLKDPEKGEQAISEIRGITGVRKVSYPQKTIDIISRTSGWIQLVSSLVIFVLLAVSVFIIANTIKLTVFARRREINIMKYIGATDWFIRWPFVVEGVIIGIVGAIVAFIITGYGYNVIVGKFNNELLNTAESFISLVSLKSIGARVILYYCLIGVFVGSAGSIVSLRKHLRV